MKLILSSAYWPNLFYFSKLMNADEVIIEQYEHYSKQSYRNRTEILTANGALALSIPVIHEAIKQATRDVKINYREKWQIRHWRAITSAYNNSPFFEFFEDDIKPFYTEQEENLLTYNLKQLETIRKMLKTEIGWTLSEEYKNAYPNAVDLRDKIHPKIKMETKSAGPYYQTFGEKFGFVPNLTVLDLLFNKGLESLNYLKNHYQV